MPITKGGVQVWRSLSLAAENRVFPSGVFLIYTTYEAWSKNEAEAQLKGGLSDKLWYASKATQGWSEPQILAYPISRIWMTDLLCASLHTGKYVGDQRGEIFGGGPSPAEVSRPGSKSASMAESSPHETVQIYLLISLKYSRIRMLMVLSGIFVW